MCMDALSLLPRLAELMNREGLIVGALLVFLFVSYINWPNSRGKRYQRHGIERRKARVIPAPPKEYLK